MGLIGSPEGGLGTELPPKFPQATPPKEEKGRMGDGREPLRTLRCIYPATDGGWTTRGGEDHSLTTF